MPRVETKADRIARKFGVSPAARLNSPRTARHRSPTKKAGQAIAEAIRSRLLKQFGMSCTNCFGRVLWRMSQLPVAEIVQQSRDFAMAIHEAAAETNARAIREWANYKVNGLTLYESIVLDACGHSATPAAILPDQPSGMTIENAIAHIGPPAKRTKHWQHHPTTKSAMRILLEAASIEPLEVPVFEIHRGIVTSGGGAKYFPLAYACIYRLRKLGCQLPIELWYLGPAEMTAEMRLAIEPLGVRVRDCYETPTIPRILSGWESKPHSIMHSHFAEVLYLDADNLAAVDPTQLFDDPEYRNHGAMFWPDLPNGRVWIPDETWETAGIPADRRHKPAFESGQVLIDKRMRWRELCVAMHLNSYSDCWYEFVYGDKDTFKLAWHKCGTEYAMPNRASKWESPAIVQHDMRGQRLFYHACQGKTKIERGEAMPRLPAEVNQHVREARDQLRHIWSGIAPTTTRAEFEQRCRERAIDIVMGDGAVLTRAIGRFLIYCDPLDIAITPHLRSCGFWESWVTLATMKVVQPGWKCVNVGANLGYYALLLAALSGETVEAFEPVQKVADLLRRSVAENNLPVHVHQSAAYSSAGERTIAYETNNMSGAAVGSNYEHTETVQCVRLDDVIDRVDLIFIDAEGSEVEIMIGAERLISQGARVIVEVVPDKRAYPAGWIDSLAKRWKLRWLNYDGQMEAVDRIHEEWVMLYLAND